VIVAISVALLLYLRPDSRGQEDNLQMAVLGNCAGRLGVVLGAISIVSAFITKSFVAIVGDVEEVLMPFATTAGVAATAMLSATIGLVVESPGWLVARLLVISALPGAWCVAAAVQRTQLVIYFATVRAREIQAVTEAEKLRQHRIQAGE
jgi:hypothetical protein